MLWVWFKVPRKQVKREEETVGEPAIKCILFHPIWTHCYTCKNVKWTIMYFIASIL